VPLHTGLLEKWEFQIISKMKLKLQDMTSESRSLAGDERINRNTVGIFFNMLEKVTTENNPSDTLENIFNIDKSGIKINNIPDL
jgi:hypothetical protein